jgi:hypothetical protein
MKSFATYLTESHQVFKYKIRVANADDAVNQHMDRVEDALKQFDLAAVGAVKHHPPQQLTQEFPRQGACEVTEFDVEFDYPATDEAVRKTVGQALRIPMEQVCVYTPAGWQNHVDQLQQLEQNQQQSPLLGNSELKDPAPKPELMKFVQDLESRKYEYAGQPTKKGSTTNDLPQGVVSPVGSSTRKPQG